MWLTKALDHPMQETGTRRGCSGSSHCCRPCRGDRESAAFSIQRARSLADRVHDRQTTAFAIHTTGLRDFFAGDFVPPEDTSTMPRRSTANPTPICWPTLRVHRGMLLSSILDIDGSRAVFTQVHGRPPPWANNGSIPTQPTGSVDGTARRRTRPGRRTGFPGPR